MNNDSDRFDLNIQRLLRREIRELHRRHDVKIALVHASYRMQLRGPADGLPAIESQVRMVADSPLFDWRWFADRCSLALRDSMAAAEYYVRAGSFAGLDPSADFETMAYYFANPDVANAGWPALVHYLQIGKAECRPLT
tara:strand:- start:192 stop:608 length:417 start_codon:yes stop_codon:yes gene_type:complete